MQLIMTPKINVSLAEDVEGRIPICHTTSHPQPLAKYLPK